MGTSPFPEISGERRPPLRSLHPGCWSVNVTHRDVIVTVDSAAAAWCVYDLLLSHVSGVSNDNGLLHTQTRRQTLPNTIGVLA